jgi:calreticulin
MRGALLCAAAAAGAARLARGETYLLEEFSDAGWRSRWVDSTWKGASMGKWEQSAGEWPADAGVNKGLRTSEAARFYGISHLLAKPFSNKGKELVVQFSVKNELRKSSFCGGGYMKLMGSKIDQAKFGGDTPYSIMFGPDLCGYDVSRIHLIFSYKGDNLLKKEDIKLDYQDKNEFTHLYTLHLRPDNTFTVYLDNKEKASGSLPEGWAFPAKEIEDPKDVKPADWVEEQTMKDPSDVKPTGHDDIPEQIVDPEAKKPSDWDDDADGAWEAPMIPNPAFKGPWVQKTMPNPAFKGPFVPKKVPNPAYDATVYAFPDIGSVGFELWVLDHGSIFDNIYVGDSLQEAQAIAERTFTPLVEKEKTVKKAIDDADKAKTEAEDKAKTEAHEKDPNPEGAPGHEDHDHGHEDHDHDHDHEKEEL